jgi:hypothetical protein
MIMLAGALLLVVLGVAALALQKRGRSGAAVVPFVMVGLACIGVAMFAFWPGGFSGFG